jgi:hypothetical protein
MNNWDTIRTQAIVEADDFQDRYDRNGMNFLFYWKTKYPNFKITLFTIPDRTSPELLELVARNSDWIELAVHGFNHESNFECYGWSYEKTKALMHRVYKMQPTEHQSDSSFYKKIFKAPGWTITHGLNGYPVKDGPDGNINDSNKAIFEDPQGVYRALIDMNFIIFDRHYNVPARPPGLKIVCVDCNPEIVHMHTWDMETGDKNGQNGFRQVEEEHGVPWNRDTEFFFISEAFEKGMFKPCQK